jgi:hypothetical protein
VPHFKSVAHLPNLSITLKEIPPATFFKREIEYPPSAGEKVEVENLAVAKKGKGSAFWCAAFYLRNK